MKKLLLVFIIAFLCWSCSEREDEKYTGNQVEFPLFQSSTYDFTGKLTIRELIGGSLELTLRMDGLKSNTDYAYPAHLHFGSYDQKDSPIAFLLNPVAARNLESVTVLGALSDGSTLDFEAARSFDGHVKIHLANEGPDYGVILVAGNVGPKSSLGFEMEQMAVCGNNY
ncbi:hypothetical protein CLV31_101429 [Algoriphagus aquaeductus]|uniref:CHRD domain-containing protein n=1 Tax=Algoriphagus aquaeductus TaxID=475299 RepID=A0A326S7Z7_9BACT|nr:MULTISPECIES: hypothetical protein [Algoriphagus]PZV87552.1 hypothetical protein CLV31_101429 [Algoriphagus aquaeductus]